MIWFLLRRRAGSAVLALVGDMATWHAAADPPLASDIPAIAGAVGHVVCVGSRAEAHGAAVAALARCALPAEGAAQGSRVVTLILPHDVSWEPGPAVPLHSPAPAIPQSAQGTCF